MKIDFKNKSISYPKHIFSDIKLFIGTKTRGSLFTGRNNTSINPSTIFRNFKEIGLILDLSELSPKFLTENR